MFVHRRWLIHLRTTVWLLCDRNVFVSSQRITDLFTYQLCVALRSPSNKCLCVRVCEWTLSATAASLSASSFCSLIVHFIPRLADDACSVFLGSHLPVVITCRKSRWSSPLSITIVSVHLSQLDVSYLDVTRQAPSCDTGVTCWPIHAAPSPSGTLFRRCQRRTERFQCQIV